MRITLTIDDGLLARAVALAAPGMKRSELLRERVRSFIQRQTARRLAALGGQVPDIELVSRRREEAPSREGTGRHLRRSTLIEVIGDDVFANRSKLEPMRSRDPTDEAELQGLPKPPLA